MLSGWLGRSLQRGQPHGALFGSAWTDGGLVAALTDSLLFGKSVGIRPRSFIAVADR